MRFPALAAVFFAVAGSASASTVSVSDFSVGAYNAAVGSGTYVTENFETFDERNVDNGFSTAVGSFSTLGGTGTGGTVSNADFANNGSKLAVRDGNVYGRRSTTSLLTGQASDDKFLDSNDTYGILWAVSLGGKMFDRIVLTLSDATDVGATMWIGDTTGSFTSVSGFRDGAKKIVEIAFDDAVSTASIFFVNTDGRSGGRLNDGFSLDDIAVSEVPIPAAGFLLLGGLGGLAALKRRKKA